MANFISIKKYPLFINQAQLRLTTFIMSEPL